MKKPIFLFILTIFFMMEGCTNREKMDIYLLLGQSNMAGRGIMTPSDTVALKNVFLLNDTGAWEPAKHPLNRYSTVRKNIKMQGINPGYEFGKEVSEKANVKLGLVVNARGGSSIREWQKDSLLYTEALKRARLAQESGEIKAIIWHQGSSDRSMEYKYLSKLKAMTLSFREDLGIPGLPIFVGQLGAWRNSSLAFNEMITHVSDSIPGSYWISAEGLGHNEGDSLHFNAESQEILGHRYAEKVLKTVYHIPN